jgi:hypothetical protein
MDSSYYAVQMAAGEAFERLVLDRLYDEWRTRLPRCETKADQITYGDTYLGLEIKFDQQFAETGNLCIEIAERTHAAKPGAVDTAYIDAGIYAASSAWLYGIGNAAEFFIFSRRTLQRIHEQLSHGLIVFKFEKRDSPFYETPTSRGFLIPRREIPNFSEVAFFWGEHDRGDG